MLYGNPVSDPSANIYVYALSSYNYWDTNSASNLVDGGSGTWNGSTANWTNSVGIGNGTWAGGTNTAIFSGTAGTATIGTGYTASVGGLTFSTTNYTIAANSGGVLSLAGSTNTVTTPSGGQATISAPISGGSTNGLSLAGGGTLYLTGTNTYSGATSVGAGTLSVGNATTTGDLGATSGVSVVSGAVLQFKRSNALSVAAPISGAGAVVQAGAGTTTLTGTNTYTGNTTISSGTLQIGGSGSLGTSGTYSGTITNSGTFQYSSSNDLVLGGAISGAGALVKDTAASKLTLSVANSYTGATTISAGTVIAGNATALGNASTGTTVNNGGSLGVAASVAEPLTINGTGASSQGALYNASGNNNYSGAIALGSAATIANSVSGTTLTISGAIDTNSTSGYTLTLDGSEALSITSIIGGKGGVTKTGTGMALLSATNSYTGTTNVNGGTLRYGSTTAIPAAGVINVNSGGTLDFNGQTLTRSANTTVTGTGALALNNAVVTLGTSGTMAVPAAGITGNGTIKVGTGTTLQVNGNIDNTGFNIELTGGTLTIADGVTLKVGTLTMSASSALTFAGSAGAGTVNAQTLALNTGTLTVSGWTSGNSHVIAGNISPSAPARGVTNVSPVNKVQLGGNAVTQTYWDSSNELLVGPATGAFTYWDGPNLTSNNNVDGGASIWNATSTNWTTVDGKFNGVWAGGSAVATFQAAANTVTLSGAQSVGGLNFVVGGYTLSPTSTSNGSLALSGTPTITTPADGSTTTIGVPITGSSSIPVTFSGGNVVLTGGDGYTGATTIQSGNLQIGAGAVLLNNVVTTTSTSYSIAKNSSLILNAGPSFTVSAVVSGLGGVTKQGSGTAYLAVTNSYTGPTYVQGGNLTANYANALGSNSAITVDANALLRLFYGQTVGSLAGAGTLEIGGQVTTGGLNTTTTFSGNLTSAAALIKNGTGTQILSGDSFSSSPYTGAITINQGAIQVGDGGTTGDISKTSGVTVNSGGTLIFNRSNAYAFSPAISGTGGNVSQIGTGTTTLSGTNTYTGATYVPVGTLQAGSSGAIPAASPVTVDLNGTLDVNNQSITRTADTTINGKLALGASGTASVTLNGGTHSIANITGSGTIFVKSNTILKLTGTFTNTSARVTLNGGTLVLNDGIAVSIGAVQLTANSTVDFGNGTNVQLTSTQINPASYTLTVANWISGQTHLYAVGVSGAPAQNTPNVSPLNQITLGSNLATQTYWSSATNPGELLAGPAPSAFTYWDGPNTTANNTADGGAGTWDVATTRNWTTSNGSVNGLWAGGSATAIFGGSAGGTVSVSGSPSFGGLTFNTGGYTISGSTALSLAGPSGTISVGSGLAATVSAPISGTIPLTINGSTYTGALTLSGASTGYTGGLTVSAGTLIAANANATGSASGSTTVSSGAGLGLSGGITTVARPLTLYGTGVGSAGALYNVSGTNTYAGPITLASASSIANNVASTTLTASGAVTNGGFDLTLDGSSALALSGNITGTGGLVKTGAGTATLSGSGSAYTGATTVNAGTLVTANANALGASTVTVKSGASLGVGGNIVANQPLRLNGTGAGGLGALYNASSSNNYSGAITLESAATIASNVANTTLLISGTVATNGYTLTLDNGATPQLTITGVIGGSGGITKTGVGTVNMNTGQTYTGPTRVSAGMLQAGAGATAFGVNSAVTVDNGATLYLPAGYSETLGSLAGAGSVSTQVNVTVMTIGTDNTSTTFSGVISGSGALTKTGTGTQTLSGANTFSGAITVSGGTLMVNGSTTSPTTVNSTGTLAGSGTVGGATIVASGGTLSPGAGTVGTAAGIGTLRFGSHLTLQGGSFTNIELGQAGTVGGSYNDLVNVAGNLTLAGTLTVTVSSGGTFGPGTYRLFNYNDTLTGSFSSVVVPGGYTATVSTATTGQVNLVVASIPRTNWDGPNTTANGTVDGGVGTWDSATTNWTSADGLYNGPWAGGSSTATFGGPSGGLVTVVGTQSLGGLAFTTTGYEITGGTALSLAAATTVDVAGTATITTPITGTVGLTLNSGTLKLNANNTGFSGAVAANGSTLQYGVAGGIPAASTVTVNGTGTLDANNIAGISRTAATTVLGTLSMGDGSTGTTSITLGGSNVTHKFATITGKGTLTVNTGATLELTGSFTNTDLNIVLAGGKLLVDAGKSVGLGTLTQTADSTVDLDAGGAATLSVATLTLNTGTKLSVNNWTSGSDHFYATSITGNPAYNTLNVAPLNQISLSSSAVTLTYWANSKEILLRGAVSGYNNWDTISGNGQVDGGSGTWSNTAVNWSDSGGAVNGLWSGTNANFGGTAGTVSVVGQQYYSGLNFTVGDYVLTDGGSGSLDSTTANTAITVPSGKKVTLGVPLTGAYSPLNFSGGGTIVLTGNSTASGTAGVFSNTTLQIGNGGTTGDLAGSATTNSVRLDEGATLAFNLSSNYNFSRVIAAGNGTGSTAGTVLQQGSGTTTLGAANGFSTAAQVTAGKLRYGVADAIPATTPITVSSSGKLDINDLAVTRTASTSIGGELVLGSATGKLTLSANSGAHSIAKVSGTGTIVVNTGTVLTLTGSFSDAGLTIQLAGGTLAVASGQTVSVGAITQTAASTLDLSSGAASLSVGTLTISSGTLTVSNWTAGTDHLYATSITGSPSYNTLNIAPLNQISLGGASAQLTYWAGGTGNGELLVGTAGSYTNWDTTPANNQVDGGIGTWNASNTNWSNSGGSFNGPWAGGTSVANFGGTGGTVTIDTGYAASVGGLNFTSSNYTVAASGTGSLALAQTADVSLSGGSSTSVTISAPITGSGFGLNLATGSTGTLILGGANTYTGATTVNAATLVVNGSTASGSGFTVNTGATLGGTGTVSGSVSLSGSATLSPGATGATGSAGTLTTGNLTLASGAIVALDLGASGTTGGGVNDLVQVNGNLNLSGAVLNINTLSGFSTSGSYVLMSYTGTRTGTFASSNLSALGYLGLIQYDDTNKQVKLVSIPRVRITQVSNGGIGTFSYVMTGLDTASVQLTTATAGTAVTSATYSGTIGTAATLAQSVPLGWPATPSSVSCVDASGASNGNGTGSLGTVSGGTVTLTAAQMRAGADITCTFTNTNNGITGVVFNDGGAPTGGTSGGGNTGTPNDGLRNGSEQGISGATVSLTNCAGTTYASSTTDGGGAYSLAVPTAQNGQGVCVVVTMPNSYGYIATGANVGGSNVLADGSSTTVSGTAYTYTRSSRQVAFTAASTGQAVINFGEVKASTLTPTSSTRNAGAGVHAVHAHSFTAGTGGSLSLSLGTASATPNTLTGWSEIAYLDPGCTGTVQQNATRLYPSGTAQTMTQGQVLCFVVQELVPAIAGNGNSNAVPVTATLTLTNAAPALTATYTATDTTTASTSAVVLTKEVRNVTQGASSFSTSNQAKPGEVLEYRITYTNTTPSPVTSFVVNDATPTYTTFVSAQADTTPAALGSCTKSTPANAAPAALVDCATAQTAGGTGIVSWHFSGTLSGGTSGAVLYRVQVD